MVLVIAVAVAVAWWLWFRPRAHPPSPATPSTPTFDQARSEAKWLPVKGWDRQTDFRRSAFGEAWSDDVNVEFGHNGCNTRDDVLRRDLVDLVVRPGTCFAQSGTLRDPHTGQTIAFVRGPNTSDTVQIDHVVSLSDAWYRGARVGRSASQGLRERPAQSAGRGREGQLRQGFSGCSQLASARSGVPLCVRRTRGRREDRLRAGGLRQREARDHRRAGRLLVAPSCAEIPFPVVTTSS
jgi:hypothetical protein